MSVFKVSRRALLAAGVSATGLVIGASWWRGRKRWQDDLPRAQAFAPNAFVAIGSDDLVTIWLTKAEIGQGVRTALPMIVAEELSMPLSDVRVTTADTDGVGYTDGTFGSRTTRATGYATHNAVQNAIKMMIERAAKVWDIKSEEIQFADGVFSSKSDPELKMTIKQLAPKFTPTGGPLSATGTQMASPPAGSFATSILDVEVDPETGKVDVLRATMVQDAGRAVNPQLVEGQMQGGIAQGVGWALSEEYYMNDRGVMDNSGFLDYRIPTAVDVPMIETIIVEVPDPNHPLGVRGVGESCIIANVPAIANAIYDAVGVRLNDAPMKPGRVLAALQAKENGA